MLELVVTSTLRVAPPAAPLLEAANAVTVSLGGLPLIHTSLVLAAWRGQEARVAELSAVAVEDASAAAEERAVALAQYARALLYNGLGRYEPACAAAHEACASGEHGLLACALPELIEGGSRSGKAEVSRAALRRLEELTLRNGDEHALGIRALSRALAGADERVGARYQEALARLDADGLPLYHARAQLLYGEWLRRQGRRVQAREQLRAAEATFSQIGAAGFGQRAHRELLASGATARRRNVETRDQLTAQEAQIATLAGEGYTNPEIGAQLYLSPRTVEWHLHKVFVKLGITSRRELRASRPDVHEWTQRQRTR